MKSSCVKKKKKEKILPKMSFSSNLSTPAFILLVSGFLLKVILSAGTKDSRHLPPYSSSEGKTIKRRHVHIFQKWPKSEGCNW